MLATRLLPPILVPLPPWPPLLPPLRAPAGCLDVPLSQMHTWSICRPLFLHLLFFSNYFLQYYRCIHGACLNLWQFSLRLNHHHLWCGVLPLRCCCSGNNSAPELRQAACIPRINATVPVAFTADPVGDSYQSQDPPHSATGHQSLSTHHQPNW